MNDTTWEFPKNLVSSWLAAEAATHGGTQIAAIGRMNERLGTEYSQQRVGEWRRGGQSIPARVVRYMTGIATPHVLGMMIVGSAEDVAAATAALSTPEPRQNQA